MVLASTIGESPTHVIHRDINTPQHDLPNYHKHRAKSRFRSIIRELTPGRGKTMLQNSIVFSVESSQHIVTAQRLTGPILFVLVSADFSSFLMLFKLSEIMNSWKGGLGGTIQVRKADKNGGFEAATFRAIEQLGTECFFTKSTTVLFSSVTSSSMAPTHPLCTMPTLCAQYRLAAVD